jgi:hypothetical protein
MPQGADLAMIEKTRGCADSALRCISAYHPKRANNSGGTDHMAITITILPSNEDGSGSNLFYAIGTLAFSGNYPTGGDTLDFTTVADKLPSTQIIQVFADSQNGNAGYYVPVQGTALNNWKLKAFTGGGTEVAAGAYPASVVTDIVQITVTARKLQ